MSQFNLTTINQVLLRVKRYGFRYNSHKADVIIAAGEAIGEIGRHAGFKKRVREVEVVNYKARKPVDSIEIEWIFYEGAELPFSSNQKVYEYAENPPAPSLVEEADPATTVELSKEVDRYEDLLEQLDADPTNKVLQDAVTESLAKIRDLTRRLRMKTSPTDDLIDSYNFNGPYIVTTFPSGTLNVHYKAYNVDDKTGLPLIIDTPRYRNAITWYIIKELILMGFTHPEINFQLADLKWEDAREAARNEQLGTHIPQQQEFMQFMHLLSSNGEVLETIY